VVDVEGEVLLVASEFVETGARELSSETSPQRYPIPAVAGSLSRLTPVGDEYVLHCSSVSGDSLSTLMR